MTTTEKIKLVKDNFNRAYLKGVRAMLNDEGAYLSFICVLTAIEALGGFLCPGSGNGPRFREFVRRYFPDPYPAQRNSLWSFRNAMVHGFSPGPYKLTHYHHELHLERDGGYTILNAEDFYDALASASKQYFSKLENDTALQAAFEERASDPKAGIWIVGPPTGTP
jgi:hypothetical protein